MPDVVQGDLTGGPGVYGVVVSRFNDLITERLLEGAVGTLRRHGVADAQIQVVWAPGSFELPVVAAALAGRSDVVAVICLGAVIQGQTTHHEYINSQVAAGLQRLSLEHHKSIAFGVLTCQTMEQALDRAGGKAGNKGVEAALAALETASVLRKLSEK